MGTIPLANCNKERLPWPYPVIECPMLARIPVEPTMQKNPKMPLPAPIVAYYASRITSAPLAGFMEVGAY